MILYFTGTGNSRSAAHVIQSVVGDTTIAINDLIKNGNADNFQAEKPYIFVFPVYAWRMPRVVDQFIRGREFAGNKKAYFIITCGDKIGNAGHYVKKLCAEKGLEFMGLAPIVMPENYVAMFSTPTKEQAEKIMQRATPEIISIAGKIKDGARLKEIKSGFADVVLSSFLNPVFYRFFVSAKGFYSTPSCTGCSRCVRLCALNNIALAQGKPQWGDACTHCMACICGCPTGAIEYKNKTQGKRRYFLADSGINRSD